MALLLVALATPALVQTWGLSEDFSWHARVAVRGDDRVGEFLGLGRPLHAWLYQLFVGPGTSFERAGLLRFLGLFGAILTGGLVFACARAAGWRRSPAWALGALLALAPGMVEAVAIEVCFSLPWAMAVSLAVWLWWTTSSSPSRLALGVGVGLLALATATYQTAPFVVVGVALLPLFGPHAVAPAAWLAELRRPLLALTGSLALYALIFLGGPALVGTELSERATLVSPLLKAPWFITFAFRDTWDVLWFADVDELAGLLPAFRAGKLPEGLVLALLGDSAFQRSALLLLVCSVAAFRLLPGTARERGVRVGVTLGLGVLAYGPLLVVNDWWPALRGQLGTLTAALVLLLGAVDAAWARLPRGARLAPVVSLVLVAVMARQHHELWSRWLAAPLACEWRAALDTAPLLSEGAVVVPQPAFTTRAPGVRSDLGWPASSRNHGDDELVDSARHELGLPRVAVRLARPAEAVPAGSFPLGCR